MSIQRETVSRLSADVGLRAMLREHWDEVAKNKHIMVLDWDEARYLQAEAGGNLLILTARDAAGELLGYSVNILSQHLHYRQLRVCMNDVLFVRPSARGALGIRLMHATEAHAAAEGCKMVGWHAKEGTGLDGILPRLGYGVQDIIYTKELTWDGTTQPPPC